MVKGFRGYECEAEDCIEDFRGEGSKAQAEDCSKRKVKEYLFEVGDRVVYKSSYKRSKRFGRGAPRAINYTVIGRFRERKDLREGKEMENSPHVNVYMIRELKGKRARVRRVDQYRLMRIPKN